MSLYEFFASIYNRINSNVNLTAQDLKEMVKSQIILDAEKDFENTKRQLVDNKVFPSSIYSTGDLSQWYDGNMSYPSTYEIQKMASIVDVDVFAILRKTKVHPDYLYCLTKGSRRANYFVFLQNMKCLHQKTSWHQQSFHLIFLIQ